MSWTMSRRAPKTSWRSYKMPPPRRAGPGRAAPSRAQPGGKPPVARICCGPSRGACGRGVGPPWRQHNLHSQRRQPLEERRVVAPDPRRREATGCRGLANAECLGLEARGDLGIAVRRLWAHVAEPSTDDVNLDARLQEVDSRGVSKHVGCDPACVAVLREGLGVAMHDAVDPEARQRPAVDRSEGRPSRVSAGAPWIEERRQQGCRALPERAGPPLVALAV